MHVVRFTQSYDLITEIKVCLNQHIATYGVGPRSILVGPSELEFLIDEYKKITPIFDPERHTFSMFGYPIRGKARPGIDMEVNLWDVPRSTVPGKA